MIFEKIDEHLDKIDLNLQLGESKEKLKDTLEENIKLQKEIDYQKNVNVIKENLGMRKTRADKAIYKIEHIYDPFIEKNTALMVELKIKEYIRDLVRAPPFFRDFVIKQQVKHLDMVLSRPDKWSPEMIQLVENGIKSRKPRRTVKMVKVEPQEPKWVMDKEKTEERRKLKREP